MSSYIKTAKALLQSTTTVADTITDTALLANGYIKHHLAKQNNINKQELELGLYLKASKAEQLVELKELMESLPDDIAKQL